MLSDLVITAYAALALTPFLILGILLKIVLALTLGPIDSFIAYRKVVQGGFKEKYPTMFPHGPLGTIWNDIRCNLRDSVKLHLLLGGE